MISEELTTLYKSVLDKVLNDDVLLPSLPDVTMKVRQAVADEHTTIETLTEIIAKDPALTAYLVQAASSPVYRRAVPATTLSEVTGLLGFSAINSLVMLHSTRRIVDLKTSESKYLFSHTWERLVVKTSVASFLAKHLNYQKIDEVQLALLLTEVGSLAVLSTMLETSHTPDEETYFLMCRLYSKKIGYEILRKWEVNKKISDMLARCGHWDATDGEGICLLDIANLSLYYTVRMTNREASLPDLVHIAAYEKLSEENKVCTKPNWLDLIVDNQVEIESIVKSFK